MTPPKDKAAPKDDKEAKPAAKEKSFKKEKPKGLAAAAAALTETDDGKKAKGDSGPPKSLRERRAEAQKAMLKAVNDKYGKGAIGVGKSLERKSCPRLSTGSIRLDYALGGGWARGRFNLVWGDRSSTKTTMMLKTIGLAQKTDTVTNKYLWEVEDPIPMVVQIIDAEGALDLDWARQHGVDTDALIVSRPETAEEAAEMLETSLGSGAVDVVVVDSLAAMTPKAELEGAMEDNAIGVQARILSKMFRKAQGRLNAASRSADGLMPTVLLINQLRTKIGVMFGDPSTKPGGVAQDFFTSIEVRLSSSKVDHFDADKLQPRSGMFKYVVVKNKLSPPKVHGEFRMMLADDPDDPRLIAGTIDEVKDVIKAAEGLGIYEGSAGKFRIYDKEFKTKRELYDEYILNQQRFISLKRDVIAQLCPKQ